MQLVPLDRAAAEVYFAVTPSARHLSPQQLYLTDVLGLAAIALASVTEVYLRFQGSVRRLEHSEVEKRLFEPIRSGEPLSALCELFVAHDALPKAIATLKAARIAFGTPRTTPS